MCPAYILNIKLSSISLDEKPTGTVAGCNALLLNIHLARSFSHSVENFAILAPSL